MVASGKVVALRVAFLVDDPDTSSNIWVFGRVAVGRRPSPKTPSQNIGLAAPSGSNTGVSGVTHRTVWAFLWSHAGGSRSDSFWVGSLESRLRGRCLNRSNPYPVAILSTRGLTERSDSTKSSTPTLV